MVNSPIEQKLQFSVCKTMRRFAGPSPLSCGLKPSFTKICIRISFCKTSLVWLSCFQTHILFFLPGLFFQYSRSQRILQASRSSLKSSPQSQTCGIVTAAGICLLATTWLSRFGMWTWRLDRCTRSRCTITCARSCVRCTKMTAYSTSLSADGVAMTRILFAFLCVCDVLFGYGPRQSIWSNTLISQKGKKAGASRPHVNEISPLS